MRGRPRLRCCPLTGRVGRGGVSAVHPAPSMSPPSPAAPQSTAARAGGYISGALQPGPRMSGARPMPRPGRAR
jgi:hypothetical protein